jgi:uncharacterized protein
MSSFMTIAFVLGLAGSLHCLVMCGPLLLAMPKRQLTRATLVRKTVYHGSRIGVYVLLGGLMGVGSEVADLAGLAQVVSITAGVLMVLSVVLHQFTNHRGIGSALLQHVTNAFRSTLTDRIKNPSVSSHAILGMLNGLLPCGLLVAALFGSLASGGLANAMLFMWFFGLGTLPMLFIVQFAAAMVPEKLITRSRQVIPIIALSLGCLLVIRGLQLGIPYLSPQAPLNNSAVEKSCNEIVIQTK